MISAIVLAAGLSTRMESKNKLLLPFKNKTIIETVIENIIDAGIEEVIVVTGNDAEQIEHLMKSFPVKIIYNNEYKSGMTTSIQKGVSVATGDGYMICLSDMPFITGNEYAALISFFKKKKQTDNACICVAEHNSIKGNPVIFSSVYKDQILNHTDMDGCRQILHSHKKNIYFIETNSDNVLRDIDTPEDYLKA